MDSLTATVIDCGDGATRIIPVVRDTPFLPSSFVPRTHVDTTQCDPFLHTNTHMCTQVEGYVVGSCIKHIPIAGYDITTFILQMLRERESGIPPQQSLQTAKAIKVRRDGKNVRKGGGTRETREGRGREGGKKDKRREESKEREGGRESGHEDKVHDSCT